MNWINEKITVVQGAVRYALMPHKIRTYTLEDYSDLSYHYDGDIQPKYTLYKEIPYDPNPYRRVLSYLVESDEDGPICSGYMRSVNHIFYARRKSRDDPMELIEMHDAWINQFEIDKFIKGYKKVGRGSNEEH